MTLSDILGDHLISPAHICVAVSAYAAWKVIYALYISPLRNVPGPFWSRISYLPLRYHKVRGTEPDFMLNNYAKYGNLFVIEPTKVSACDPEDCVKILGSHAFTKDGFYDRVDFIEPNIFLTRDPELSRTRHQQIGPALSLGSLLRMESTILDAGALQLLAKWDRAIEAAGPDGSVRICYYYDFQLMAFDVIGSLGFGQTHRSLTTGDRKVVTWVRQCFSLLFLQMVAPIVKRVPLRQLAVGSLHKGVNEFIGFVTRAIEARKRQLVDRTSASRPEDILQSFLDAKDPKTGARLTTSQVTAETMFNMVVGADTSALTLCWTLHLLLLHPEHLRRLTKEVRAAFAAGHTIAYEEAKERLPFLEACLYESMRLRPIACNLPRNSPPGGVVLQGHFIPEGYTCSASLVSANVNKGAWDRPLVFDPERFLGNDANKRMLLTFSSGVRMCPGRHLAWLEMTTALANILSAYDVELPEDALFTPDRLDANGQPAIMPHTLSATCAPKFPDRDCIAIISKRKDSSCQ